MLKTEREKRICAKYSAYDDETGYVHCDECPLRVDTDTTDVGCRAWMHYDRHVRDWVMDSENGNYIIGWENECVEKSEDNKGDGK